MKKSVILFFMIAALAGLTYATEICVVAEYGSESELEPDTKCVSIDEGQDGYTLLRKLGWDLVWGPETSYGHMLCMINDVGTEVSGQYCAYSGEFWNVALNREGKWMHIPVGLDGSGGCWDYDVNSWNGHYCTQDGDVLALSFGKAGSSPSMFIANVSRMTINGVRVKDSDLKRRKIGPVAPGSDIELKLDFVNKYGESIEVSGITADIVFEDIDNGGDLEEEISEFELRPNGKESKSVNLKVPLGASSEDRLLKIHIAAEDDSGIKYELTLTFDVSIKKDAHSISISRAELDKASYACGTTAVLRFDIVNSGQSTEDVSISVKNSELALNSMDKSKLATSSDEPSVYSGKFNLDIPAEAGAKEYPLNLIATYFGGSKNTTIALKIDSCEGKTDDAFVTKSIQQEPAEDVVTKKSTLAKPQEINDSTIIIVLGIVLGVLVLAAAVIFIAIIRRK